MTHSVIVPGVGGSEHQHWQSWLQRQLVSSSRVEQKNWDRPVLVNGLSNLLKQFKQYKHPYKSLRIVSVA